MVAVGAASNNIAIWRTSMGEAIVSLEGIFKSVCNTPHHHALSHTTQCTRPLHCTACGCMHMQQQQCAVQLCAKLYVYQSNLVLQLISSTVDSAQLAQCFLLALHSSKHLQRR
jgi:hypothetical protein